MAKDSQLRLRIVLSGTLLSYEDCRFVLGGLLNYLHLLRWEVPEYPPSQQLLVSGQLEQETGMLFDPLGA